MLAAFAIMWSVNQSFDVEQYLGPANDGYEILDSRDPSFVGSIAEQCSQQIAAASPLSSETLQRLGTIVATKDQFETSQQYAVRLSQEIERRGVTIGRLYSVTIPIDAVYLKYDADEGALILPRGVLTNARYTVRSTRVSSRTYVGSNSFGANRTVRENRFSDIALQVSSGRGDTDYGLGSYQIKMKASPVEARHIMETATLEIAIRIRAPFFDSDQYYHGPTTSNPNDIMTETKLILVDGACRSFGAGGLGRIIGVTTLRDPFPRQLSDIPAVDLDRPAGPLRPPVTVNPTWSRRPAPIFPEEARAKGVEEGRVEMSCTVGVAGGVSNCSIVSETPSGSGFGAAALVATRQARLTPRTVDGVGSGGEVRFTVPF